ncbi:MAG TPA: DUF6155 family protein [Arenibacter sp.]|nr:DUF6155 family protein [Arenibacter sp.]
MALTLIHGMGKRELTRYLTDLKKKDLEVQIMDLYNRFPIVREYYNFVFNPNEDKLVQEAKIRIANEYISRTGKRPKARRSVAQKIIKHFITLGVDPPITADLMLYNLEIAQTYSVGKNLPASFYKSMGNSFNELVRYVSIHGLLDDLKKRIVAYYLFATEHNWPDLEEFSKSLDILD